MIGEYFADLLIDDIVVVELKTAKALAVEHEGQVLAYLKSANLDHGLLINFGSPKFQIRKFAFSKTNQAKVTYPSRPTR